MQKAWAEIGRDPEQFWRLTLRQIMLVFAGEADRRFRETEIAYFTAWHSGLFSQQYDKGRFPKYEKNAPTRKRKGGPVQSWQQQKMMAKALNAAFGGTFTKRGE